MICTAVSAAGLHDDCLQGIGSNIHDVLQALC